VRARISWLVGWRVGWLGLKLENVEIMNYSDFRPVKSHSFLRVSRLTH